jgi:hypothetical protein
MADISTAPRFLNDGNAAFIAALYAGDKIEALACAGAVIARSPAAIGTTMRDLLRG